MKQAWCKAQVSKDIAFENVSPWSCSYIVVAHIFASSGRTIVGERCLHILIVLCRLKEHEVGIMVSGNIETMLVGCSYKSIVAVYKLYKPSCSHTQSGIACSRLSLIALSYVYYVVTDIRQIVKWRKL